MGILRADRITGLGGANAITGSTSFGGSGNHLKVEGINDDFVTWWTADFTIEAWVFLDNFASWMYDDGNHFPAMVGHMTPTSNTNYWSFGPAENNSTNTLEFYYWKGSQNHTFVHTATIKENEWTHIAMSFSTSNGAKLFINGTGTSYISLSGTPQVSSSAAQFVVGQYNNQNISGNISNLRILKGTALYTSDFTPPTNRLEKTSDTKLLICNSASDVTHNDDEKIIIPVKSSINNTGPVASRFTPNSPVGFSTTTDVGSQYGSTFDGFGSFATSTYMVPPGGNTRERNRGRGLVMGGGRTTPSSAGVNNITFIEIQSQGNAQDFGDLTEADIIIGSSLASSTRGIRAGGYDPSPGSNSNTIDFVTIANTANATDFGDLIQAAHWIQSGGSQTRGVMAGGNGGGNVIQYVTIATAGNSQDFGDLINSYTHTVGSGNAASSPTRMLIAGGTDPSNNAQNIIQYVTIASTGDAVDFGDLTDNKTRFGVCSNATRGLYGGGGPAETDKTNTITFVTLASTGNTVDFGDRIVASNNVAATSNSTRGVFIGGGDPSATINTIDFVIIASTGNATDFGDNVGAIEHTSACSDSHGGIS